MVSYLQGFEVNLDGPTATVIAAMAAVLIAFVGFVATVHLRLGRLEKGHEVLENGQKDLRADNAALRELVRSESEQTRTEIRRLAEAMLSHYHDEDGNTKFSVPPA